MAGGGIIDVVNFPILQGTPFWNNALIGSPKSGIKMSVGITNAYLKEGEVMGDNQAAIVGEALDIELKISDFTIAKMNKIMGLASALGVPGTLQAIVTSGTVKSPKEVALVGTTPGNLQGASMTNIVVTSLDGKITYTVTTDYTIAAASPDTITRVALGDITDGQTVRVWGDFVDAAAKVSTFGGNQQLYEAELCLVFPMNNGKYMNCRIYRAIRSGGFDLDIFEDKYNEGVTLKWKALHDKNKVRGKQLCEWVLQIT